MAKPIIVIYGTTGTGKSQLAIKIAQSLNTSIISADSRKIYKGLTIGTHKDELLITKKDKRIKQVYGLDLIKANETFNAHDFLKYVNPICDKIHKEGKIPIIVGGTVMYITALINNYTLREAKPQKTLRKSLEKMELETLQKKLQSDNIEVWNNLNESEQKNKRRVIRWIEILSQNSDISPTEKRVGHKKYEFLPIKMTKTIEDLREILPSRVEKMVQNGLIEETSNLLRKYKRESPGLKIMGYQEAVEYINKEITIEEMKEKIVRRHVKYAKYQLRWIKKYL